jgi:hypothetical protein
MPFAFEVIAIMKCPLAEIALGMAMSGITAQRAHTPPNAAAIALEAA